MSELENENISIVGSLMQDISFTLDESQQRSVLRWAVKTSMVTEAVTPKREYFYTEAERKQLRGGNAPSNTAAWVARYNGRFLHNLFGTDVWRGMPNSPGKIHGYVNTITVGYFALQVVTFHLPVQQSSSLVPVQMKVGDWDALLTPIWPATQRANWPPTLSFDDSATRGLEIFRQRWSLGTSLEPA